MVKADPQAVLWKTLDELEGVTWGPPTYGSSLVRTCHRLRTKPVGEFETEDLRIMIGQNIGLPWLLPLAVDRLEENPWAAGDMYPGDLLKVTAAAKFPWTTWVDLRERLRAVIDRALVEISAVRGEEGAETLDVETLTGKLAAEFAAGLRAALARFDAEECPAPAG